MAALMRSAGERLWTLESMEPVAGCDLWGFTLPHELTYTNVLEMLDLAGVPLRRGRARGRGPDRARRRAGGRRPVAAGAVLRRLLHRGGRAPAGAIVESLEAPGRAARLRALAEVPGVWVPGATESPVRRQVFTAFSTTSPVVRPVVPVLEAVHDRAVVEVMRGCTAGCRFCQAGMWYRPVRERPVDLVVEARRSCSTRPAVTRSRCSR